MAFAFDLRPGSAFVSAPTRGLVLVVDDHPLVRDCICDLLVTGGYEALAFRGGPEALAALSRGGLAERALALLVDYSMPEMTGAELLARLAAHPATADLPALLVSADAASATEAAARLGCGWLAKPFDGDRLLAAVEELASPPRARGLLAVGSRGRRRAPAR
jgi:two-component system chemotaxis response regulator CheY